MNKKILALALAALMSVSMTSVAFASGTGDDADSTTPVVLSEITVSSFEDLKTAIENEYKTVYVDAEISVTSDFDGKGVTIILTSDITGTTSGTFVSAGNNNVKISNITIDCNNLARHGVQFYRKEGGTLSNVKIIGGTSTSVIVNGSTGIVLNDCQLYPAATAYANIEYAVGDGVQTPPSMTVSNVTFGNSSIPNVWADATTLGRLGLSEGAIAEQIASVINVTGAEVIAPSLSNPGELVVVSNGTVAFEGTAEEYIEYLEEKNNHDDGESRSSGGDYFGNAKWDEAKREIAAAEEGDTIEMSATGLPWFPSSVARALKGKDVTLEVRKNGVTYSINGLEIGAIEKIWYEFDQIDTELLTVEAE